MNSIVPRPPSPPDRPPEWEEALAYRLFLAVSPRLGERPSPPPPRRLQPCEPVHIPRSTGSGTLSATWYPARLQGGVAQGAVLCLHPWLAWGRAYFHRRGRLEALRRAGYHALTVDLPGFGDSGPAAGFFDRDIEDALRFLDRRVPELPIHLWGVSSGGYWAHPVLSRHDRVAGAMFEDVSSHLFEWSERMAPWGWPCYRVFRGCFPRWYRYLDLRRHAPLLRVRAAAYVSGELDRGVLPEETRQLAELAGGDYEIVAGAGHLESIKRRQDAVIELALATFERAQDRTTPRHFQPPRPAAAPPPAVPG
jgi:pimeloyl-ACP methyl ester carboxylesterase